MDELRRSILVVDNQRSGDRSATWGSTRWRSMWSGPSFHKEAFPEGAKVREGVEELTFRRGEEGMLRTFIEVGDSRKGPSAVDEDWHAGCQAIYRDSLVEITRVGITGRRAREAKEKGDAKNDHDSEQQTRLLSPSGALCCCSNVSFIFVFNVRGTVVFLAEVTSTVAAFAPSPIKDGCSSKCRDVMGGLSRRHLVVRASLCIFNVVTVQSGRGKYGRVSPALVQEDIRSRAHSPLRAYTALPMLGTPPVLENSPFCCRVRAPPAHAHAALGPGVQRLTSEIPQWQTVEHRQHPLTSSRFSRIQSQSHCHRRWRKSSRSSISS